MRVPSVEKQKYDLFFQVLRRMTNAGILDKIVLVGSWCLLFYENYFQGTDYHPSIRTRDIDFLIPIPTKFKTKIDVYDLIKDLGFVIIHKGPEGYITFQHPELILEFLVPERGRGHDKPYPLPDLGINAQRLRFLDLLSQNTVGIDLEGIKVKVPHPANYALHKLIIGPRRKDKNKLEKDTAQAVDLLKVLIDRGESQSIIDVFNSIPKKWQHTVRKELTSLKENDILKIF